MLYIILTCISLFFCYLFYILDYVNDARQKVNLSNFIILAQNGL